MTFTIDLDNHITAHGTPEEAAAATATPFDSFSSQQQLAELAKAWPAQRLVAIWNSQTRTEERPSNPARPRQAASRLSWSASSASRAEPRIR